MKMKTDGYTLIKDQEDRFYFIPESQIEFGAPLHDTCSVYESGDYTLMNSDSCCSADFCRAGAAVFGERFTDLEWNFNADGSIVLENLEELGFKDQEEEVYNFVSGWREENESISYCDYYSYWDGHENKYIVLSCDTPDVCTPDYEVLEDYESAPILKAFGQVAEWENESPGIKVAYCGGYKFIDSSWDGHIGSYEGVLLDEDERMEIAESEESYESISTTSERSGFPKNEKQALIGFDTFEEAEEVAEKYGLQVSEFYSRDGWQFMYRNGAAYKALEYRPEDFGDDYEFVSSEDIELVLDTMRNRLEDCTTWEEAKNVYEAAEKVQESMDDLEDDEVLVVNGLNISDTVHLHTMRKYVDSQTWVIGVEAKDN